MRLEPGDVIDDKYEIVRPLGQGGMGVVYEGSHRRIHRRVAIKVLHASIARDDVVVTRFEREAEAAGRIGSEHIVEVLDVGRTPRGQRYMVMEYLEGESLQDRLKRDGPMLPEQCFPIAIELLEGLAAAHRAGIVHRDLKPENIWLLPAQRGSGDFVKILDFGVSKFRVTGADKVTLTGVVVGTPAYMAPEQATADRDVDHRADLYVVGVILYRCLSGQLPYEGATYNELMYKLAIDEPPPLGELLPGLDPGVEAIVERATRREREQRFPDAGAFRDALERWLHDHGFPVSLAVQSLLQSGDRIAAELLRSGDRVPRHPHLEPDGETIPLEKPAPPAHWDDDSDTAVRPLSYPRPDDTTAIDQESLAAMSLADQLESGARLAPTPPVHASSAPPSASHFPPSMAPPASAGRPRTVPLVFAGVALVVGMIVGVGMATCASPGSSLLETHAPDIRRVAAEATPVD